MPNHHPAPSGAPQPSGFLGGLCSALMRPEHPAEAHRHPEPDVPIALLTIGSASFLLAATALAVLVVP